MRSYSSLFSFFIFMAVAGLLVVLLVWRPGDRPDRAVPFESMLAYELQPGEEIEFLVPPDNRRMRMSTNIAAPPSAIIQPGWATEYPMELTWIDDQDNVVLERTFYERSRVSQVASDRPMPYRSAFLEGDGRAITDSRSTGLPASELIPAGGILRVRVPEDGHPLFIRAWGEQAQSTVDTQRARIGPSERQRERQATRMGLPEWWQLGRDERAALSGWEWFSLSARGDTSRTRWIQISDFRLSFQRQLAGGLVLKPGRSVALNFRGAVTVRLSGGPEIRHLTHRVFADLPGAEDWDAPPQEGGIGQLVDHPAGAHLSRAEPLGFHDESRAFQVVLPDAPVTALHLTNPTDASIGPILISVDEPEPTDFFGWTVGVRLSDLLPDGWLRRRDTAMLAPEWRFLAAYIVGPDRPEKMRVDTARASTGELMQVEVRARLEGRDDRRDRLVHVTAYDVDDVVLWASSAVVAVEPAPYEFLVPDDGTVANPGTRDDDTSWLSEPVPLYLPLGPDVAWIELDAEEELLLNPRLQGPAMGEEQLYPLDNDELRVRYARRSVKPWHPVRPTNEDALVEGLQLTRFAANVRLEPRGHGAGDGSVERRYTSVHPVSRRVRATGRSWMLPVDDTARTGPLYCRYDAGDNGVALGRSAYVAGLMDRVLSGVLWTPDRAALGRPFGVWLDGELWRNGTLTQRVTPLRDVRVGARGEVAVEAPAGSQLWLRSWGSVGSRCPHGKRGVMAYPLSPGAEVTFAVNKRQASQLFILGALGHNETEFEVRVLGGEAAESVGFLSGYTRLERSVRMQLTRDWTPPVGAGYEAEATKAMFGVPLNDPDLRVPALQTTGLMLGPDLANGRLYVAVRNASDHRVHVRAGVEAVGSQPSWSDGAIRLVQTEEVRP